MRAAPAVRASNSPSAPPRIVPLGAQLTARSLTPPVDARSAARFGQELAALGLESDAVVVAQPLRDRSELVPNGDSSIPFTITSFAVERLLIGPEGLQDFEIAQEGGAVGDLVVENANAVPFPDLRRFRDLPRGNARGSGRALAVVSHRAAERARRRQAPTAPRRSHTAGHSGRGREAVSSYCATSRAASRCRPTPSPPCSEGSTDATLGCAVLFGSRRRRRRVAGGRVLLLRLAALAARRRTAGSDSRLSRLRSRPGSQAHRALRDHDHQLHDDHHRGVQSLRSDGAALVLRRRAPAAITW